MTNLVWPNGTLTEPVESDDYGPRTPILTPQGWTRAFHTGKDWVRIGKMYAIGAGTVAESSWIDWAGWQVLIDLGVIDGERTWVRYAHLAEKSSLRPGARVELGDFIGNEGDTGMVTGRHLHMEIYRGRVDRGNGNGPAATVDPQAFIRARLGQPEEDDDMSMYFRATENSSPLKPGDASTSRIWAGDGRVINGVEYSGVWERSADGSVRRLFTGEWAGIQEAYGAAGRKVPLAGVHGNVIEQMYLVGRARPKA